MNNINNYYLKCRYDTRASFYNKAEVYEEVKGSHIISKKLYSYNTLVCEIIEGKPVIYGFYSMTTTRHIKEFLKQEGFNINNKKDMEDYLK